MIPFAHVDVADKWDPSAEGVHSSQTSMNSVQAGASSCLIQPPRTLLYGLLW